MLQNIDLNKLNSLMNENEDAKQIISQLLENHHTMISSIAHEIRNPLTLVSSSLQVIEMLHPEAKEFSGWSQMMEDIQFIKLLLDDLSTFNNSLAMNFSVFSLETFLKNICISFAMALEHQHADVEFISHIPDSLGYFTGDKIKLEQVLLNILRNAHDAVGTNGSIRLSAIRQSTSLIIQIQDNGCGIPKEHLKTIFDPFVTYKANGTGLGLAISKKIIDSHKGTITVDSTLGSGTIFSLRLPL